MWLLVNQNTLLWETSLKVYNCYKMACLTGYIFIALCIVASAQKRAISSVKQQGENCPIWMKEVNGTCTCEKLDKKIDIFQCNKDHSLKIQPCYCVSYYKDLDMTVVGNCLYSCTLNNNRIIKENQQNQICDKFSRTGELCSKCKNETGYPLYSYSLHCVTCDKSIAGFIKYISVAFIPLTIFYLIVIAFRISVTSEALNGYVMISQLVSTPTQLRYMTTLASSSDAQILNAVIPLFAIWNLDFFRSLYKPFCVDSNMSIMLIVSLEYVIAVYPLCLILFTYILVKLHDTYYILKYIWKPVHKLFSRMRRQWNIKRSLIDAFATFILLSYIKILNASFDILLYTTLYDMSGHTVSKQYLYNDGSRRAFHGTHLGYAFLALIMILIFNIAPLLILTLYPCGFFHIILNHCNQSRFQILHTFMDSFHSCYRMEPIDCRYYAAFMVVARFANLTLFSITLNRFYYPFGCLLFIGMAGLIIIVRPYKSSRQNIIDAFLYLLLAFAYASSTAYALSSTYAQYNTLFIVFICVPVAMIILYVNSLVFYHLLWLKIKTVWQTNRDIYHSDEDLFNSIRIRNETRPLQHPLQKSPPK